MQLTRLGVIDLGSNSGRLILALRQIHGIPLIVDEAQVSLRLAEGLHATGKIGDAAIGRARDALLAFQAAARNFGVQQLITVGTSALRDASNRDAVVDLLERAAGVQLRVLSGDEEAYYGYLSAANSLPISNGLVLDLGGGSLELTFVRDRAYERSVSLPLGALRLKERFLSGDPPTNAQVAALRAHVAGELEQAGVGPVGQAAMVTGGGGTVRTLAKLIRKSSGAPSMRLHGYAIQTSKLAALTRSLLATPWAQRRRISGMPAERSDIIAAGAVVVQMALELSRTRTLIVSGQGLREGIAYEAFRAGEPPLIGDVRRAGIDAFRERYVTGIRQSPDGDGYARAEAASAPPVDHPSDGVATLAVRLFEQVAPVMEPSDRDLDLLTAAAALCDAGRAVSLYRWPEHAVYLLTNGDLSGFTQREAVVIGEAIASQEGQRIDLERYGVTLPESEVIRAGRLGVIVGIARWLRRSAVEPGTPLSVVALEGQILVVLPPETPLIHDDWREGLERGCRRYFGRELRFARLGD